MRTLDSLIDDFEQAVAANGVKHIRPPEVVSRWEAAHSASARPEMIIELLRVWLEHRVAANLSATPKEAAALFPDVTFSAANMEVLEFEYSRLLSASDCRPSGPAQRDDVAALPELGTTWDGFDLLEVLGEGAFARVYLARQRAMADRVVALKLTRRATRESQMLARLHHSAIVPVYSMHRQAGVYGLCMPYLGNTTLADLLREILPSQGPSPGSVEGTDGLDLLNILEHRQEQISTLIHDAPTDTVDPNRPERFEPRAGEPSPSFAERPDAEPPASDSRRGFAKRSPGDTWHGHRLATAKELARLNYVEAITWIGAQLADALDHAHRHNVLHCDIKPANVLLAPDGQARLLDFNVSLEQNASALDERVGGTPAYMAPEHLAAVVGKSDAPIDQRSDVYSLGVVLFEMLAGTVPRHASDDPSHGELPVRQLLRKANPAVSPALAAIVGKCLARDPQRRYPTAEQLYNDLNAHCNHLPLVHQAEPSLRERCGKWVRRHPLLTSVTSVSLLAAALLLVSLTALAWRGKQLERLTRAHRGEQVLRLAPAAIALTSAARNYPDLAPEAAAQTQAILDLLRIDHARWDLSPVQDASQLRMLVRLHRANQRAASQVGAAYIGSDLSQSLTELATTLDSGAVEDRSRDAFLNAYLDGRFADAVAEGETISQQFSSDYATWVFLGHSYLQSGDFPAAQECFSVCLALQPNIEVAWFYRGIARLESQRYAAAARDFRQAIAIQPKFPSANYNLALALERADPHGAVEALDSAIAGGWRTVSGFALRSRLHARLGSTSEAEADLENARRRQPVTELDWVLRGTLRLEDEPEGARDDFEQALRINSQSVAARQNLAHVLAERLSRPEEAVRQLDELIQLDPDNPQHWAGRGVVQARLKRLPEAVSDLSHASTLKITNPLVGYQVACGYSLIAEALSVPDRQPAEQAMPSREQIADAAFKWYAFSLRNDPKIAQIAAHDSDLAWLRTQAKKQPRDQVLNLEGNQ